jgi:hypothetical protein
VIDAEMVADTVYRPANLTRLEHQLAQLTKPQLQLTRRLATDIAVLEEPAFTDMNADDQVRVAQAGYDYLRYTVERAARDPATARRSYDLLAFINRTTTSPQPKPAPSPPIKPENGHQTMLLSAAGGVEDDAAIADFEWRVSYHDLLDASPGFPAGASLNMGRIVIRARENDSLQLQRLDMIEITSLSPRSSFFKPFSWRVDFGLERQWTKGDDPLVAQVNGGAGLTWAPVEQMRLYTLAIARLEYNSDLDRELDIAGGAQAGLRLETGFGNGLAEVGYEHFTDDVERTRLGLGWNLPVGTNHAFRLKWQRIIHDSNNIRDQLNEISFAYRYYY